MANNKKHGSSSTSWDTNSNGFRAAPPGEESAATSGQQPDKDQGQIQDVIGHFGKYQLLIFVFKILIGVTSAFNNLSVTFFAPSDFISFKCLSGQNVASSARQQNVFAANNNNNNNNSILLPLLTPPINGEAAITTATGFLEQLNNTQQTTKHLSNENLFHEFLFSEERQRRRNDINFNTDTPLNLIKECKYYSENGMKNETCKSFKYDTGIWISTIIDEWDLVCDRGWFVSMTQSLYMSGFIISFLVFGYLSDRFGRWRSLLLGALIEVLSGFGCAYAPSVTSFMIFRFLLGIGNAGRSSTSYLIMIEWCGPKWRMHISTLGTLGWVIGYCTMPWITLYFLHFRHMQLFVCFYEMIFLVWLLYLPESPRWLLTRKKFDKAYDVLLIAAKFNGIIKEEPESSIILPSTISDIEMSSESCRQHSPSSRLAAGVGGEANRLEGGEELTKLIKPITIEQFNAKFRNLVNTIDSKGFTKNENKLNIFDLFRWPNLRKYAFILYFAWASNSFIYYGIILRVGDFGGSNLFKTSTISGLTELPSIAFTMLCMKFMPRRTTNLFIFTAVALLCGVQLPLKYYNYKWLQQSSILLAKLFNSCSFTVILYQTMELFPTSIRQTAYSSCSVAGRIGSILAPFVKELAQATNNSVPPMIYTVLSAICAVTILYIPETRGTDMPDTLLEAEKMEKASKTDKPTSQAAD